MSGVKVPMFRVVCDWPDCGVSAQDETDYYAWADLGQARDDALSNDWRQGCDGKDYCPDHPVEWSGDHEAGEPWPEAPFLRMHDGDDAYPNCDDGNAHLIAAPVVVVS